MRIRDRESAGPWWRVTGRAVLTVLLVLCVGPLAPAGAQEPTQEKPPPKPAAIAGKWTMSLEMAMGTATIALEFKQETAKITGTYTGGYGTFPLEGEIKGRELEFAVYTTIEGQESTMYFAAEVAEDGLTMRGPATLGQMGEAVWSAKRAK